MKSRDIKLRPTPPYPTLPLCLIESPEFGCSLVFPVLISRVFQVYQMVHKIVTRVEPESLSFGRHGLEIIEDVSAIHIDIEPICRGRPARRRCRVGCLPVSGRCTSKVCHSGSEVESRVFIEIFCYLREGCLKKVGDVFAVAGYVGGPARR